MFLRRAERAEAGRGIQYLLQRKTLGGREYYHDKRVAYGLPKDEQEIHRLDFQHFMLRQVMQGNYMAPIDNPKNILDVGAGTGRWAIEMAQSFPDAQVIGLDLEEVPTEQKRPRKYLFQQGNVLYPGLPYGNESFDFVHMRLLAMGIPTYKWAPIIQELLRVTRPGGWVELVETGNTIFPEGPLTRQYYEYVRLISRRAGINLDAIPELSRFASAAGMQHIKEFHMDVPIGQWAGRIGRLGERNMECLYEAIKPRLIREGNMPVEKVDEFWTRMVVEWNNRKAKKRFYVICGQK